MRDPRLTRYAAHGRFFCFALLLGLASAAAAEFQVNTQTIGDQAEAAVASDASGNVLVVWNAAAAPAGPRETLAQRYDSNGVAVGSELVLLPTGVRHHPDVAMADDGRFVVTWMDGSLLSLDGDQGGIFMQRFSAPGVPVGTAVQVNTYTTDWQGSAKVAAVGDGSFIIIWESNGQDGSATGVYGQRFDSGGSPTGSEFQVNTYTTGVQGNGILAVDAAPDGSFVATWHSRGQDDGDYTVSGGGVYAQRYAADGSPLGGEFRVNTTTYGAQGLGGADVVAHWDGSFTIVWNGNNFNEPFLPGGDVFGRRYASDGSALGGEFRINASATGQQIHPVVADDAAGNFLVAYRGDDRDRTGIFGRYYTSDGVAVGPDFRINSEYLGDQNDPAIASDPAGRFFVSWDSECRKYKTRCEEDQDGDGAGVFAERFSSPPPICAEEPRQGCEAAAASKVRIKQGKLTWTWKSESLSTGFGQPVAGLTNYILCLYRDDVGASSMMLQAALPAGEGWQGAAAKGSYRYGSSDGMPQGIVRVKLRGRAGKKGKIRVKGQGTGLEPVSMPVGSFTTITTQLVNGNGDCWESEYHSPAAINKATSFRAKFK